ncbi:hypothetical protein [Pendulispora albinea]|uniref:Uncharacterized protein n=1 Tax=Pendulispora albinea TaxID=2741071 RepID=A0ABZ2M292_9BACT
MTPNEVLLELEKLARRIGIRVRHEPFEPRVIEGKGGLCWVHGRPIVMIDAGAPVLDKIGVLAAALARFDIEALYVPPVLRQRIDQRRQALAR